MLPREIVSFVFPRVSMFPSTSSRETLRLSGKQNSLFPSGAHIKCIMIFTQKLLLLVFILVRLLSKSFENAMKLLFYAAFSTNKSYHYIVKYKSPLFKIKGSSFYCQISFCYSCFGVVSTFLTNFQTSSAKSCGS